MTTELTSELPAEEIPIPEATTAPAEDLDPEKDGLTKGQATASVHGDILDI